ncbi:MAG: transporter substrate-binding domain-containing protein [Candidatus Lokiarchaeota archaeon]|nr:transporter substrate-binding domain-containing protein [Candidatus Lokiarchaeota archaeon]
MAAKKLLGIMLVTIICSAVTNLGIFTALLAIDSNPNESLTERIVRKGVIRLGTSPDYPPFESIQEKNGVLEVAGFDIELAKLLAANMSQQLGRPVEIAIEAAFFNALMAGLQSRSYDFVIAAFAIRPDRELQVDFSIPYYFSQQCCIVPIANSQIQNETHLVNKIVAVQIGTSGEELAGGLGCIKKPFPTVDMLMLDLINGGSDAAIIDIPVAEHFVNAGNVKIAFNFTSSQPEGFGVAMREGEGGSLIMGIINRTISWLNATNQLKGLFKN